MTMHPLHKCAVLSSVLRAIGDGAETAGDVIARIGHGRDRINKAITALIRRRLVERVEPARGARQARYRAVAPCEHGVSPHNCRACARLRWEHA